jgi:hypothetical protein
MLAAVAGEDSVWGMLMETEHSGATATLFAVWDGTTSLYLSSGGGMLGGHAHDTVREANAEFLETANRFRQHLRPASAFPLPAMGRVTFYGLTDLGVLTADGAEHDLAHGHHALSALFHAGLKVLTQLRSISEGKWP